jgi:hypothetical protein
MALDIKVVVFSRGEATTQLCIESIYRQGFDVEVWADDDSYANKLVRLCMLKQEVIVVSADVIVNSHFPRFVESCITNRDNVVWCKPHGFSWWTQELRPIGVMYLHPRALSIIEKNISSAANTSNIDMSLWVLPSFKQPFNTAKLSSMVVGIEGYGIGRHMVPDTIMYESVDFDWVSKLNKL